MNSSKDANKRRTADRIHIEVEVSLDSESHFFTGLTGDLSSGGVFIATCRKLAVGDAIHLRLMLPTGEVQAQGRVRWARDTRTELGAGVGVAFDSLDPDARNVIERFCAARPPLYYDFEPEIAEAV
jgi:uncharacterized protein (TIGR02266 family)